MKVSELMRALSAFDPDADVLWYSDANDECFAAGIKQYQPLGTAIVIDKASETSEGSHE